MSRLRAVGRWVTDWRNGAVLAASVLVGLLAVIVIDSIDSRRDAHGRADRALSELQITVTELQRRGVRIDALAGQLEQATASRDQLAEEVRALRETLIDAGLLEPRASTPAAPSGSTAPPSSSTPRPVPASSPAPQAAPATPEQPAEPAPPPLPPQPEPEPGLVPALLCPLLPLTCP